jgi:hypothetical protein
MLENTRQISWVEKSGHRYYGSKKESLNVVNTGLSVSTSEKDIS